MERKGQIGNIYFISKYILNIMIGHILELEKSKEIWECLQRLYSSTTKGKQDSTDEWVKYLKNPPSLSVSDSILKIKHVSNSLAIW